MRRPLVNKVIVLGDIHAFNIMILRLGTRFLEEVGRGKRGHDIYPSSLVVLSGYRRLVSVEGALINESL